MTAQTVRFDFRALVGTVELAKSFHLINAETVHVDLKFPITRELTSTKNVTALIP
ncbi:MAG TPA: hypothetical protein VOA64_00975 [Candidatus Dormibacteraeota bacterium]|nr:hypothetical protein [Candidatus Dormibacteraeota bacterium]